MPWLAERSEMDTATSNGTVPPRLRRQGDDGLLQHSPPLEPGDRHRCLVDTGFGARRHIPSLDGLRGVAVLAVIVFHLSAPLAGLAGEWFPDSGLLIARLGQRGVDLFFVLSGFLIGGILIDSRSRPGYFRNFFARRALRIFPLYFGAGILLCWVAPALGGSDYFQRHQWWYWSYTTNWPQALGMDIDFGHFWSLAVEEQFYLVWPVLLFFLRVRGILWLCAGALAVSTLSQWWFTTSGAPNATFTLCCIGQLAAGTAVAALARTFKLRRKRAVHLASAAVALVAAAILLPLFAFYSGAEVAFIQIVKTNAIGILFAAFLFYVITASKANPVKRLLSLGALRWVGKYSYAMYVVHPFLIAAIVGLVLSWTAEPLSPLLGLGVALAIFVSVALVSWLSWHLFEKHFMRLKRYF